MPRTLKITTGKTSRGGRVSQHELHWLALAKRLRKFRSADISLDEYRALSTDAKSDVKDAFGFFIGGHFSGNDRKKANLVGRSLLTLDIDYAEAFEIEGIYETYRAYAYVVHSSMSHSPERPKLRLIFPLTRDLAVHEYEPVARRVAEWFSIDAVDRVSYRPSQLMYFPAHCSDVAPLFFENNGAWMNPDDVLASFTDPLDWHEWPVAAKDRDARGTAMVMEDPGSKPGIVGAFCRAYDIHTAIEKFELPYEKTAHDNRYTPAGATGSQGVVIYPSDSIEAAFLYSHHSNDIASNRCLNAWDLVRLHKFERLDHGHKETGIGERPSQREMIAFAAELPEVVTELAELEGFEELPDIEPESRQSSVQGPSKSANSNSAAPSEEEDPFEQPDPAPKPASKLSYDALAERIDELLSNPLKVTRDHCKQVLRKLAAARLDAGDEDVLLGQLRQAYPGKSKPRKDRLQREMEEIRDKHAGRREEDGEVHDIALDIVQEVLREHFADGSHIRRVGKMFWTYRGGVWAPIDDELIKALVIRTVERLRCERPEESAAIVAAVGESDTPAIVGKLWTLLPSRVAGMASDSDPLGLRRDRPPVINCANGEIWFDVDGRYVLRPHNPANFFTSQVPVAFDSRASAPEWVRFLDIVFSHSLDADDMRRHLEEIGGYLMQQSRWLRTWILFSGRTAAGKSTIGMLLSRLLGNAVVARSLTAYSGSNTHAEAGLVGKLLLLDDDFDKDGILPDGFIKRTSEAKLLTANPKGKDEFAFVCRAVPMVIANHAPATRDLSDALIDRALVFYFGRTLTHAERDDARQAKMLGEELPGIFAAFVRGFARLRARGRWLVPCECVEARRKWTRMSNTVGQFLEDCIEAGDDTFVPGALWSMYGTWMHEAAPSGRRVSRNEFLSRCEELLGAPTTEGFAGIKIKEGSVTTFD
jgi:P4 family phage/plasmid primase-like protien